MAYDQANTCETIELFCLTEKDADLPIPEDNILKDSLIRETFETLLGQLRGTGLDAEIEPLAHGLATILLRRKVALGNGRSSSACAKLTAGTPLVRVTRSTRTLCEGSHWPASTRGSRVPKPSTSRPSRL